MSFVDHTQAFSVPYTPEDTFKALKKALNKLSEFKVDKIDENLKTIYAKAGVSLFSWGENITISIGKSPDGTWCFTYNGCSCRNECRYDDLSQNDHKGMHTECTGVEYDHSKSSECGSYK